MYASKLSIEPTRNEMKVPEEQEGWRWKDQESAELNYMGMKLKVFRRRWGWGWSITRGHITRYSADDFSSWSVIDVVIEEANLLLRGE